MITMDSFGSMLPANWEEIAEFLNNLIEERGIENDKDELDKLWEDYCNGDIPGAPEAEEQRTLTDYEIRETAYALNGGGWTQDDKEQFIEENAKQDAENVLSLYDIDRIFAEIARIESESEE